MIQFSALVMLQFTFALAIGLPVGVLFARLC
jgi:hypothetical protein